MFAGPFIAPFPMDEPPPNHCSVTVVGASLAGLATAWFLAREGVDVTVLEAAETVAAGQSGRDLGFVELGVVEYPHRTLRALGDRAAHLLEWTGRGKQLLDEEGLLERSGLTWIATQPQEVPEIEACAQALLARGIPAKPLPAEAIAERTGTRGLLAGVFLPDEARIDPWRACATLATRLQSAGGRIVGSTAVQAIDDVGDELVVRAPNLTLTTDVVVLAAGYGSAALDEALQGRLISVREQLLSTSATHRTFPGVHRAGQGWMRWQQLEDGRVVLGGARWASPHLATGETEWKVEDRIQARLDGFLAQHFGLSEVTDRWASGFATTPDGLPILGRLPGDPRRVALVGLGGSPAALSVAGARAVATGLLEGEAEVPRLFSPRRIVQWRRA